MFAPPVRRLLLECGLTTQRNRGSPMLFQEGETYAARHSRFDSVRVIKRTKRYIWVEQFYDGIKVDWPTPTGLRKVKINDDDGESAFIGGYFYYPDKPLAETKGSETQSETRS